MRSLSALSRHALESGAYRRCVDVCEIMDQWVDRAKVQMFQAKSVVPNVDNVDCLCSFNRPCFDKFRLVIRSV